MNSFSFFQIFFLNEIIQIATHKNRAHIDLHMYEEKKKKPKRNWNNNILGLNIIKCMHLCKKKKTELSIIMRYLAVFCYFLHNRKIKVLKKEKKVWFRIVYNISMFSS